ncbi:MAG: hypothetical protein LBD88_04430 [Candidatus Peribacteria bacterium]|nr:hypothetical protein [Candidatus Peribacteria bacterium]
MVTSLATFSKVIKSSQATLSSKAHPPPHGPEDSSVTVTFASFILANSFLSPSTISIEVLVLQSFFLTKPTEILA